MQTQIRLLQEEQSDQGLHCLQFRLHLLGALTFGKAILFKFNGDSSKFLGVRNVRIFTVVLSILLSTTMSHLAFSDKGSYV